MIQKYEILVTEKGVDETAKKFENLGNQAAIANQKAAGFFGMANAPTATAFKQAFADVQRYGRALQNIKAPGKEPYALISRELESMTGYAQQYHSMLTKVTGETRKATSAAGQFQKATYPPSAITPGITGFTPIAPVSKEQLSNQAQSTVLLNEEIEGLKKKSTYMEKVEGLDAQLAKATRIRSGIVQSQLKYEKQLEDLTAQRGQMSYRDYQNEEARLKGLINNHDRERRIWTEKIDNLKKYGQTLRPLTKDEQHANDVAIAQAQKGIRANNKAAASKRGEVIENDNFNRSLDNTAKKSNFLNSNFAKFSIIMSGIAATLFVWQTVSRVIASIVGIGTNMETAYAKVADKLKLSADQMQRLNQEARKQASAGGPPVQDYVALVAEFEKWGATHEAAIKYVNAALEKERELLQGTVTGELKEFAGLWREIATQSFEASKETLVETTSSANDYLRNIVEAQGALGKLVESVKALWAAQEWGIEKAYPSIGLIRSAIEWLINNIPKVPQMKPIGNVDDQDYLRYLTERDIPDPNTDRLALERASTKESENMVRQYTKVNTIWGMIDTATWNVKLNAEEIDQQTKNMTRDVKTASDILGNMNAKQLEDQMKNIMMIMQNIKVSGRSDQELMQVFSVLEERMRQINIQPQMNVWQSMFKGTGIMDERLYDEQRKRIEAQYKEDLIAMGGEDPQNLALKKRNDAMFKLDQDYYAASYRSAQSFYELFGSMQDEYISYRQAQINKMYDDDLTQLGNTRAEMLKTEREYILQQQKLQTPMAFYKKYYDEFGIMNDKYYKNEQEKINHEYEANKKVNEAYAERMKTRQQFVLDSKKLFSDAFEKKFGDKEGQGGITMEGIQNMEQLAESTGYVSQKLKDYWEIRNQLVEKTIAGTTGDREAGRLAKMKEEYDQEVLTKSKLVGIWEDYYQKTGIMSEGYYNYQIWSIKEIEKMDALATGNSLAAHAVMLEKKKQLDREYELSKMGGGFYKEAEQWDIQAPQAYYDKLAEMDREQAEDYIEAGADRLAVEEWLHKKLLALRAEQLSKSKESVDGFELQAIRVELATKTAAERTAETINRLVEGTKDVFSDQIFGLFQGEFDGLFNLFEDLAGNWKKMIDRMVSDWLAAGIAKMLFGDLAGGTGLGGGTGQTGGFGWLGQVGTWLGLGLGALGGGTTQTGMTGQSINPYLQLVKAKGGVFTTIGELHRFASGGIFNRETQFAYAGGMGVLGESGPEAIVPLKRGKDGKLGISSFGEGQNVTISPTIIVQAPEGRLPRDSMNQLTSRLGQTIYGSMRKNG